MKNHNDYHISFCDKDLENLLKNSFEKIVPSDTVKNQVIRKAFHPKVAPYSLIRKRKYKLAHCLAAVLLLVTLAIFPSIQNENLIDTFVPKTADAIDIDESNTINVSKLELLSVSQNDSFAVCTYSLILTWKANGISSATYSIEANDVGIYATTKRSSKLRLGNVNKDDLVTNRDSSEMQLLIHVPISLLQIASNKEFSDYDRAGREALEGINVHAQAYFTDGLIRSKNLLFVN